VNAPVKLAAGTFVICWAVLVATAPGIPVVWDEGEYLYRAQRIIDWFALLPAALSRAHIREHWLFIGYAEGHPAGFVIPIALGKWLAAGFADPLTAARLGPITVFSAACAAVALQLRRNHGLAAAIVAPLALLTFPRMFAEAHFATQDGQLTAWWLILWVVQSSGIAGWRSAVGTGIVLGLTTAVKFSGWTAWAPTLSAEVIQRRSGALRTVSIIVPVALLLFYLLNPPLWHDPLGGLREHFHRNLNRELSIPVQFLGQIYNLEHPLPWYNTLVWLVFVTPLATLVLGGIGVVHGLARPTVLSLTVFLHFATLMIVRALPGAPPHDGVRLFLPALGFWCVLAGLGAQVVFDAVGRVRMRTARVAARAAAIAALFSSAVSVARYYPQTLSHYSVVVGGLRGAASKGMEPTYWWDALDNDVLGWLHRRTDPDRAIAFSSTTMGPLHALGRLRPSTVDPSTTPFQWYVLQNRPGMFSRIDRALMRRETPVFVKYAGRRSAGTAVPGDLDVPLISIFSFEQYQRARRRAER
jgi:hypothetical protein